MSRQAVKKTSANYPRILVVDDDSAILDSIKILLEDEGYQVKTMPSGLTIRQVINWQPSLIMLDVLMAGFDGRDIIKQLKHTNATSNIPVVFVSANRRTEQFARESGADGFIVKPFDIDDLLAITAKFTKKSR